MNHASIATVQVVFFSPAGGLNQSNLASDLSSISQACTITLYIKLRHIHMVSDLSVQIPPSASTVFTRLVRLQQAK